MRYIVSAILSLFCVFGAARLEADEMGFLLRPFDAGSLTAPELRFLQVALTSSGHPVGRFNGSWNRETLLALENYSQTVFSESPRQLHVATLVTDLWEEIGSRGWEVRAHPEIGLSFALPVAMISGSQPEGQGTRWWGASDSLTALTQRHSEDEVRLWHRLLTKVGSDLGPKSADSADGRLETSGALQDGRRFHSVSLRIQAEWATVHVVADPSLARQLDLIVGSIGQEDPQPWALPENGRLDSIVETTFLHLRGLGGEPPQETAGIAAPIGDDYLSTGTAFYISPNVLITAGHVVSGCRNVFLRDGTGLDVLAFDADLDIAALRAPRDGRVWLEFRAPDARLGQRIHAVGFPYYSITGTSLHLTSGNVSALAGLDDDRRFFSFTAPVQPGNSGGPLLDAQGAVSGVVVSRLSESYIEDRTGSVPQNLNYALGTDAIRAFISRNHIEARGDGVAGYEVDMGAPPEFADAVVPIVCQ